MVVMQKDLGSALHFFFLFLFVYYIGTGSLFITAGAVAAGIGGSFVSYHLFSHIRVRIQAWQNPWADIEGGGYQVVQSLIAIGSGGLVGLGLGLGEPFVIPASRTDFIFAALCEEMGVIVGGLIIGFYFLIMLRGMAKTMQAEEPMFMLMGAGATVSLSIQAFIIIGGVIKLIPLTGITLPFVSYGGSSMLASFGIVGILQGIALRNARLERQKAEARKDEEGVAGQ